MKESRKKRVEQQLLRGIYLMMLETIVWLKIPDALFSALSLPFTLNPWFAIIAFVLFVISLSLWIWCLIFFYLASLNMFFTFVDEGTYKQVVQGGALVKTFVQKKGYTLDSKGWLSPENSYCKNGKVVSPGTPGGEYVGKEPWHPFRGLRLVGNYLAGVQVYVHDFAWIGVDFQGKIDTHPKEAMDYTYARYDFYLCFASEVETAPPEKLPVDMAILLEMIILNADLANFAIDNWHEAVMNRFRALQRDYAASKTYEKLLAGKSEISKDLWKLAETEGLFSDMEAYGIHIKTLKFYSIDTTKSPTNPLRDATLKAFLAQETKKATIIEAEATSEALALKTMGALVNMISEATGRKPRTIRKQIRDDENLKKEIREFIEELISKQISIDGKSYFEIKVEGATGIEKTLLNLITAFKKIPA